MKNRSRMPQDGLGGVEPLPGQNTPLQNPPRYCARPFMRESDTKNTLGRHQNDVSTKLSPTSISDKRLCGASVPISKRCERLQSAAGTAIYSGENDGKSNDAIQRWSAPGAYKSTGRIFRAPQFSSLAAVCLGHPNLRDIGA
ncbi:MAG: hypothetical protein HY360_07645 [Verrucomicrobia bacterium]|nr:hypothetical protein [Verrucomicrobiota bacterium]